MNTWYHQEIRSLRNASNKRERSRGFGYFSRVIDRREMWSWEGRWEINRACVRRPDQQGYREKSEREIRNHTCNSLSFKYLFLTKPIANKVMTCTLCRSCLNCRSAAVNAFDFLSVQGKCQCKVCEKREWFWLTYFLSSFAFFESLPPLLITISIPFPFA